jgi:hypothetical protein
MIRGLFDVDARDIKVQRKEGFRHAHLRKFPGKQHSIYL